MKAKGLIIGAALALALSAPVKADPIFDDTSGIGLDTSGTAFMNGLYEGYEALSLERGAVTDLLDAEHFNHKARRAARRSSTMPDELMDRLLRPADMADLRSALARLRKAYDRGARTIGPDLSATAQVSYDCWIEAAEGTNPAHSMASHAARRQDDVDRCKAEFEAAMSTLDSILHANMTVLTRDVYQRFIRPNESQGHYINVGRAIVVGLLVIGYLLSVGTFDYLVVLVTLSGAGALQLMPAILGVCFPGGRTLTRAGVVAGIAAGLVTLYVTLVVSPHPLGMHGGLWGLLVNTAVALNVSAYTTPPSAETIERVHGEVERFVYGTEE